MKHELLESKTTQTDDYDVRGSCGVNPFNVRTVFTMSEYSTAAKV